jgi:hypothetical protein
MPVLRTSPPSRPSRDKKFKRPFPSRKGSIAAPGCWVRRPRRTPCGGPPSTRCFQRGRWQPHARARALSPNVHRKMDSGKECSRAECARLRSRLHCVTTRRVASSRQGVRRAPQFDFRSSRCESAQTTPPAGIMSGLTSAATNKKRPPLSEAALRLL